MHKDGISFRPKQGQQLVLFNYPLAKEMACHLSPLAGKTKSFVKNSWGLGSVEEMLPTLTSCKWALVAGGEEGQLLFGVASVHGHSKRVRVYRSRHFDSWQP